MRIQLRAILPFLVLSCATSTAAEAQIGFPGGVRNSPRPVTGEARPLDGAGLVAGGPALTWLLGSAGNTGKDASGFSAAGGFRLSSDETTLEGTVSYVRNLPDGLDASDAFGGTLEFVFPLPTALNPLKLESSVSGEAERAEDGGQEYTVGAALSRTLSSGLELGGSMGYGGSDPEAGESTSAWIPGATVAFHFSDNTTLRANYTFDNERDGDDAFAVVGKHELHFRRFPALQVSAQIDDKGDFEAGIIFEF